MILARYTTPELLPCPLCGSEAIVPVIRTDRNGEIKIPLYHCNHCGMEASQHRWAEWARPGRASQDNGGKQLCSSAWLGDGREKARKAFVKLHQDWLAASHRKDMNEAMDALAIALDLDPLTLRPSPNNQDEMPRRERAAQTQKGNEI